MKKLLITIAALAVATPAAAVSVLDGWYLDKNECNKAAADQRKASKDNSAFFVCVYHANEGIWRVWTNNR